MLSNICLIPVLFALVPDGMPKFQSIKPKMAARYRHHDTGDICRNSHFEPESGAGDIVDDERNQRRRIEGDRESYEHGMNGVSHDFGFAVHRYMLLEECLPSLIYYVMLPILNSLACLKVR